MAEIATIQVQNLLMTLIDRPDIPDRITIAPEYIKELAASIAEIGLMNPITVSKRGGRFEVVAGDCRFQAFMSLGRSEIPAFVCDLDAENISVARATENLQRSDLSVIEEAQIYRRLHDDHNMSWDAIGKRTGKSPGVVKRRADLIRLPECLVKALHEKKISYSVAEELGYLKDVGRIEYYLGYAIDHGATTTVVRDWVREELALIRQHESDNGGGGWGSTIPETKPIYVSCDICTGPMEINKVVYKRICKDCDDTINQNMKVG